MKTIDLSRIAESMDVPYRPLSLATIGNMQASLFVCDEERSWHRNETHDAMLLVLEGVLVLEVGSQKSVANEGEMLMVPRKLGHNLASGMRSTVLLFQDRPVDGSQNGLPPSPLPGAADRAMSKINAAAEVLSSQPYEWMDTGRAGHCRSFASRLWGKSSSFMSPEDAIIMVYRGVLNYKVVGSEPGSIVGSQMMLLPAGTPVELESERGATVVMCLHEDTAPPSPLG